MRLCWPGPHQRVQCGPPAPTASSQRPHPRSARSPCVCPLQPGFPRGQEWPSGHQLDMETRSLPISCPERQDGLCSPFFVLIFKTRAHSMIQTSRLHTQGNPPALGATTPSYLDVLLCLNRLRGFPGNITIQPPLCQPCAGDTANPCTPGCSEQQQHSLRDCQGLWHREEASSSVALLKDQRVRWVPPFLL